jgi:hypothetical protein
MAITAEDLNYMASLAAQGQPFAQQISALGFRGPIYAPTGRQEERFIGSENPTMVDVMGATPEFTKFAQEQGLSLGMKDLGFASSDVSLMQGDKVLGTYSSRPSGLERAMNPVMDYGVPAFLAFLGAQAVGGLSGMGSAAGAGTTPGTIPMGAETLAPVSTAVPTGIAPASIIEGSALATGAGTAATGAGTTALGGTGLTAAAAPAGAGVISSGTGLTLPASMASAAGSTAAAKGAGLTFGQQLALSAIPALGSQIAARQQAGGAREAARIAAEARAPYTRAAEQALSTLSSGIAPGGQFAQRYDYSTPRAAQLAAEDAARRNIEQSAASRGGLLTSNTLDQIQRESARIGASYQNQDFNQWLAQQQLLMKPLETMVGMGSQQISQVADVGSTAALAAAGSRAGATMQTANLLTSGISRAMNQEDILQRLQEILGTGGGGPGRFSDERLKSDVRRVGTTDDGLPVYVYRMGDGPTQMGVMAQEIEERDPEAVSTDARGYKMVDYDRVS